jgi:spermidine/putrescine transport system permease protein
MDGRQGRVSRALSWLIAGGRPAASHVLLAPATVWLLTFLVIPVAFLLALSLTERGPYGSFVWTLTSKNFVNALDAKYLPVLFRTLTYAGMTTVLCLILGFPLAYFMSFYAGDRRDMLMVLLMVPFWTSCLVSIYSWIIILGRAGLMNSLLMKLGLITEQNPILVLNTPFSVVLGMVYFYIPFMILPLYGSLEKIPRAYIEASYDLGAGQFQTFYKITLPLSLPGIFAGSLLTFIPCVGDFLTAEFLGGSKTFLLGNLIQNQFLMAQDWPFGAALTALLLVFMFLGLYFYQRLELRELERA